MRAYDDPSMYRWTELHPDAAEIAAGHGVGRLVRVLSATDVVAEGSCQAVSLSTAVDGPPLWRLVLDGVPVHVAPGDRAFAAFPIPAVPHRPEPVRADPRAVLAEIEAARDRAVASAAAVQACAEESAAILETVRRLAATPPARSWWSLERVRRRCASM